MPRATISSRTSKYMISKHFLLCLEGAETVLDDTPDNLKIVEKKETQ